MRRGVLGSTLVVFILWSLLFYYLAAESGFSAESANRENSKIVKVLRAEPPHA